MTRIIHLSKGCVALVDEEDYDNLMQWNWYCCTTGYAKHRSWEKDGERLYMVMHRVIMKAKKGQEVDHINGNRQDNRRANLRIATRKQNASNSKKRKDGLSSKYKGVTHINRSHTCKDGTVSVYDFWRAYIQKDNKYKSIGFFKTEEEAARAYDDKATELFGEFARLNFPK